MLQRSVQGEDVGTMLPRSVQGRVLGPCYLGLYRRGCWDHVT